MSEHQQNQYKPFIEQNSLSSSLLPENSLEGSSIFVMQMVTRNGHVNRPIGKFSISQLFPLDISEFRWRAYDDSFSEVALSYLRRRDLMKFSFVFQISIFSQRFAWERQQIETFAYTQIVKIIWIWLNLFRNVLMSFYLNLQSFFILMADQANLSSGYEIAEIF